MNVHQSRAKTAQIVYTNGHISFSDYKVKVYLNPVERTLYTLSLNHPEGITSDDLVLHWKELSRIKRKFCDAVGNLNAESFIIKK